MAPKGGSRLEYQCSFCGKTEAQVRRLIAGPGRVFICDECVNLCQQIVTEENVQEPPSWEKGHSGFSRTLMPRMIHGRLDEYVVGQERAKKVLSVAVYNHYKRVRSGGAKPGQVELQKSNIMLIGPTGCGKTLLAQTMARTLDVPFAISDATSLTEAGYVGEDVEHVLLRLIQAADWDIARAEQGMAYIDEIDKIARKGPNPSITRDVSGEGVQQGLLKIIEGTVANVPPAGGRKHPHQEFLQIKTDHILFVCGGAFEGLEQIVERRIFKDRKTMGFKAEMSSNGGQEIDGERVLQYVIPEDLVEFGFIPEFVGRMSIVVALDTLTKEDLVRILTEPKNAVVKQYQHLFAMEKVELLFTPEALDAAAEEALKRKTGARGLRTIIEESLLDVMYELPSLEDVCRCIMDAEAVRRKRRPILLNSAGSTVEVSEASRKQSA